MLATTYQTYYRALALVGLLVTANFAASAPPKLEIPSDEALGFYLVPRSETMNTMKRVGLMPVRLPALFEDREDVKVALHELVTQYLTKAGIEVVQQDSFVKAYDRLNAQLGGVYNADSGEIKIEQWRAVQSNALREFTEKEHLNGTVIVSVRQTEAEFYYTNAFFDGAKEFSLGRLPPNFLASLFLDDPSIKGSLGAWSVVLQISNNQNKVVYGRFGGIQLSTYYDPGKSKGAPNGFLHVPIKELLRDRARLDRAIKIATDSLIRSPEQIAKEKDNEKANPRLIDPATLPLPPEGISRPTESPFQVPRDDILARVHKVILAPITTGKFTMPQEAQDRYLQLIASELKALNWEVIVSPGARDTMNNEFKKVGALFNPLTGKMDDERAKIARQKAVATIGVGADAILWPSLFKTNAPHSRGDAKWDGASQNAFDLGPVKKKTFWGDPVSNSEGNVAALSLSLQLRDNTDAILYQSRGGVQLLQQIQNDKEVDLAPTELFQDASRDPVTIHAALRHLVLTPEDLDKELHPNKYKNAKKTKKDSKKSKDDKPE